MVSHHHVETTFLEHIFEKVIFTLILIEEMHNILKYTILLKVFAHLH